MKAVKWIVGAMVLAVLVTALPSNASAEMRTIAPGDTFTKNLKVDSGQLMPYQWSSDVTLHFTVTDPDGIILTEEDSNFGFDVLPASKSGTYHFTWDNTGSTVANLNLINFFSDVERGISNLLWGILIVVIVVIAVIVVIVLVVMSGDEHKTQPVQQFGLSVPPMAAVDGKCPMCRSPVDPQGTFCDKCGARLK